MKAGDQDCTTVNINFGAQQAGFAYDEATKTYKKTMNGEPQVDGRTGNQLSFTNLFILETSISVRDDVGRKELDWAGGEGAKGYYISNGGVQEITWRKEGGEASAPLTFYGLDGEEILVNRGKSYIAVTYPGSETF